MMAAFAVFLIKERVSKAKHLQFLSGAGGVNFWLSTFVWDLFHYIICSLLIFIVWAICHSAVPGLKKDLAIYLTAPRLGYAILLFVCYGFSQIPLTYLTSYLFQIPASGFAWITIINIITSNGPESFDRSFFIDLSRSSDTPCHRHSQYSSTGSPEHLSYSRMGLSDSLSQLLVRARSE